MIKYKKKSNKLSKFLILIFPLFFVFLISFILHSNFFTIKLVDIKNNVNCADKNQIKTSSHIIGQNFFLVNEKKINNDLKDRFICIKTIHFLKFFPNKINLEIYMREPVAVFVKLKDYEATISGSLENIATPSAQQFQESYLVDSEGIIFAKNLEQLNLPRVYLDDSNLVIGKKVNLDILRILEKIKSFGLNLTTARVIDNFLILYPNEPPKIIFRLNNNLDTQIASLQLILKIAKIYSDQLEFIDLRFDKPIVRIAPKK